ncbi:hypothetical protein [Bacillus sp. SH5-2]|uniref:hypothetical protein n=1 Tax=Bacillus sp. SH5-2 TaxID=2217834 RepID=UPI0011EF4B97|nr:hypothetical protein [Bacillus sp. SH5-2]KAA0766419.1 hypothetical protein DN410_02995 [Bacillus sp. SH5-2]
MGKKKTDLHLDLSDFKKAHTYKECFHKDKDCSKRIIRAHSIQDNKILVEIAENGLVLMFSEDINESSKLDYKMEHIGRRVATTFRGFCNTHDTEIFSPIENKNYCNRNRQQEFIFAYRVFAKEYHTQKTVVSAMEKLADYIYKGEFEKISKKYSERPPLTDKERIIKWFNVKRQLFGPVETLKRMEFYKEKMNRYLDTSDFEKVISDVIEFDEDYHIAVSAMTFIELDLHKNVINDLTDFSTELAPLFVTVFPQNGKTYVLMSYLKEHQEKYEFIKKQILNQDIEEQKVIISNLIVFHFENFALSPKLWNKIPGGMQQKICDYHKEAIREKRKAILNDKNINLFV